MVQAGMDFRAVEENLRDSFRVLAQGRSRADVIELPGLSIASLGVSFQMFNAAFLSAPVVTVAELEERIDAAHEHFRRRNRAWSFWFCEDWLERGLRRRLSRTCDRFGLRLTTEMPGMTACSLDVPSRDLPRPEFRRVEPGPTLTDFRTIGSDCFHVPMAWFSEVFDESLRDRAFVCWVGYNGGVPVSTAASVTSGGTVGIYNIATSAPFRGKGYGEAITRHAIAAALPAGRVVLQSTAQGLSLYRRIGFDSVTRFLVYNSL
jgi:GNAT superfamily N-acetyltransferase